MNNLEVFADTKNRIYSNKELSERTKEAVLEPCIFSPGFQSEKNPHCADSSVQFEENLTLLSARDYSMVGKRTAVLNFANPVEPGGGVLRGASAQEEYLCRAGNLYFCLVSSQAEEWYAIHRKMMRDNGVHTMLLSTDSVLYSKGVTFFRKDVGYKAGEVNLCLQEYTDQWISLDVITCAAPFFNCSPSACQMEI